MILVAVGILAASVGGYFWWKSKTSTPAVKQTINPKLKGAAPSANQPSYFEITRGTNWKIYGPTTCLNVSFKIPSDILVAEKDRFMCSNSPTFNFSDFYFWIEISPNIRYLDTERRPVVDSREYSSCSSCPEITVGGLKAVDTKFNKDTSGAFKREIFVVNSKYLYDIVFTKTKGGEKDYSDEILSTFAFHDQDAVILGRQQPFCPDLNEEQCLKRADCVPDYRPVRGLPSFSCVYP